jgi:lipopolysaccharide biosynthesis glycosyltransferase
MKGIFNRERNALQSTEFSFSRFLVPFLSNFSGWSVFMDCDMVARADFAELLALRDEKKSVMVCKHDYVPKEEVKFLGQIQTKYEKKNWSSLILFNNAKCRTLTADYVNTASGLELHQFKWLENDNHIGELPLEWNWLVGEYPFSDAAKVVHYTKGGPYFNQYRDCDYAADWMSNRDAMLTVAQMN